MSSGPAMSSTKRSIASDDVEPSRATRTRLASSMAELLGCRAAPVRRLERRATGADQENRGGRGPQHALRHAAEHEPAQTGAAVARHDDEIGATVARGLDDGFRRRAVPHRSLDLPDAGVEHARAN